MIRVDLNEETENRLRSNAEAKGMPVEAYAKELLENAVHGYEEGTTENRARLSARDALGDYVGAIDSSASKADPRYRSGFGDILDQKFTKQGITLPEWER